MVRDAVDESSEPDLESMLRAGVDIDDDGVFDPTCLLQQPLDQDIDDLDELGINVEEDEDGGGYLEQIHGGTEGVSSNDSPHVQQNTMRTTPISSYPSKDDRNNENFYDECLRNDNGHDCNRNNTSSNSRNSPGFFNSPAHSPPVDDMIDGNQHQYDHRQVSMNEHPSSGGSERDHGHSPPEYDHPSHYNNAGGNNEEHFNPPTERQSSNRHPRSGKRQKRHPQRIAEVQQRILQVQEKIREVQHENMDHDQMPQHYEMRGDHYRHDRQEHGYQHQDHHNHHRRRHHRHHHQHHDHDHHDHHDHHSHHYNEHQRQPQGYPENFTDNAYNSHGSTRDFPRDSPYDSRDSYNRPPSNMRSGVDSFRGDHPRHHQQGPHQPPLYPDNSMRPHSLKGRHSPDDMRANGNDNDFCSHDRTQEMNSMRRGGPPHTMAHPPENLPNYKNSDEDNFGGHGRSMRHQQQVVGGMSQSLNGIPGHSNNNMVNNSRMHQHTHPQNMRLRMSRSLNGSLSGRMQNQSMNGSNNGGITSRMGIQSMSDSLNGIAGGKQGMDNHVKTNSQHDMMDRSNNGRLPQQNMMDRSNDGNMTQHRSIHSMSNSLNGIQNTNDGNISNQNGARNGNNILSNRRGIQSLSRSLNGLSSEQMMSQSVNGIPRSGGNGGFEGHHQGHRQEHRGSHSTGGQMSRSLNGPQNIEQNYYAGSFRQHQGGMNRMNQTSGPPSDMAHMNGNQASRNDYGPHNLRGGQTALQGMSQSLNGAHNVNLDNFGHRQSLPNKMNESREKRDIEMNNNNNIMRGSTGMGMNPRDIGSPVLNNSSVPSAPLLNQVSNLAKLPNRGSNPGMMQQLHGAPSTANEKVEVATEQGGNGTSKRGNPMALAEATMRSASSRKMIREFGLSLVKLQSNGRGQSKSFSSSNSKETVVKAKRKSGRESYTMLQSEAAFREHSRQTKMQQDQTTLS
ncbi:unnamed protein product [Pseudo-nitzschia multistriata]|uniref:Uncharacterized protein n=1 Tax=Pseudo-nitzschia multistriata TaxID=183589 RepID=A0A448Z2C7_9STRA|nr:unnamed protein product [Pseudo-nitzschia multistriata]